jgi:MFS transporter, DHA1 family, multidrug resistance protein
LSPYIEFLGGSYTLAGMILSSYWDNANIMRLPIGIVSDLLRKRKPFIVIGMFANTISCILFLMTPKNQQEKLQKQ